LTIGFLGLTFSLYIRLTVQDTGCGIDKEKIKHIFEPFYTTKETGKGTGLGLAMVYGIVKNHRGYIECTSVPGEGAAFDIYFPVSEFVRKPYRLTNMLKTVRWLLDEAST
jgi:signal transduction histidine kinase